MGSEMCIRDSARCAHPRERRAHLGMRQGALVAAGLEARAEGDEVVRVAAPEAPPGGEPTDAVRDAVADLGLRLRSILPEHTSLAEIFSASQAGPDDAGSAAP